jgi:CheY-like chemotaxis protein
MDRAGARTTTGVMDTVHACRPHTILVVDDHPLLREAIGGALADQGYSVEEADGGTRALELLAVHHYCAALVDVHMPDMDGLALVEAMAERGIRCPVLMTSAAAGAGERARIESIGAFGFHAKPLHLDALLRDLRAATGGCTARLS